MDFSCSTQAFNLYLHNNIRSSVSDSVNPPCTASMLLLQVKSESKVRLLKQLLERQGCYL